MVRLGRGSVRVIVAAACLTAGLYGYEAAKEACLSRYRHHRLDGEAARALSDMDSADPRTRSDAVQWFRLMFAFSAEGKRREYARWRVPGIARLKRVMAEDPDPVLRMEAARTLIDLDADDESVAEAVQTLIRLMTAHPARSKDDKTRYWAAFHLSGAQGGSRFIGPMTQGMKHADPQVRLQCALALARRGDKKGYDYLMERFERDGDAAFQERTVRMLHYDFLKEPRAKAAFRRLAASPHERVRRQARRALSVSGG